jgi:chromosome partitioning protein
MGDVIAVGNLKGGTGKSTIAVNLACALAADGTAVTLVDADGQATASDWHAGGRLPVPVKSWPLVSERDAQAWVGRVLALKAETTHVVVDLPPQVGSGIASALLIADLLLIPVTPSGVDLRATGKALDLLRRARTLRGGAKPACMLVPSRVDRRTSVGRRIHGALERFGLQVGPGIRQRAAHVEAFEAGAWIGAHAPSSPACREITLLKDRVLELMAEALHQPVATPEVARPMTDPIIQPAARQAPAQAAIAAVDRAPARRPTVDRAAQPIAQPAEPPARPGTAGIGPDIPSTPPFAAPTPMEPEAQPLGA